MGWYQKTVRSQFKYYLKQVMGIKAKDGRAVPVSVNSAALVTPAGKVLGGVEVEHHQGLAGHSDADVVCHALCDAILGAICSGDIGSHFPDSDPGYKGISSLILLDKVIDLCTSKGMALQNADITIVCQTPKLAPYVEAMKMRLAHHCRVGPERLNIKATTTEKMGYVGREEGISCHAVVLVRQGEGQP